MQCFDNYNTGFLYGLSFCSKEIMNIKWDYTQTCWSKYLIDHKLLFLLKTTKNMQDNLLLLLDTANFVPYNNCWFWHIQWINKPPSSKFTHYSGWLCFTRIGYITTKMNKGFHDKICLWDIFGVISIHEYCWSMCLLKIISHQGRMVEASPFRGDDS